MRKFLLQTSYKQELLLAVYQKKNCSWLFMIHIRAFFQRVDVD